MKTIWKYTILLTDDQTVRMPEGATILSAQVQKGSICLWALVDPSATQTKERAIEVFGTGNPIEPGNRQFISTVQTAAGAFVWHVFEKL